MTHAPNDTYQRLPVPRPSAASAEEALAPTMSKNTLPHSWARSALDSWTKSRVVVDEQHFRIAVTTRTCR
ncbi:hypothetical protein ACIBJI_30525 [Nocardia sp. NPDC050408]|uniref:hypothetical protein n=1 Tax=Nocardia sp. NPDC050408 TaxID=3364319 RepID=UPI00378B98CC